MTSGQGPLNNAQLEILKLFNRPMSDKELYELKDLLAQHYAKKAMDEADRLWDERGYTQETMDKWLTKKS